MKFSIKTLNIGDYNMIGCKRYTILLIIILSGGNEPITQTTDIIIRKLFKDDSKSWALNIC